MIKQVRHCKFCDRPIDSAKARADRQYCDERCKNAYHNSKNMAENVELQRIELVLRKNRRILKKMFTKKDSGEMKREKLLKDGFDFDYHTHHVISKIKKNEFIFCYDFGYCALAAGTYKIVKAFEYKED
jgi:predicted nucleic acid-binding Zn ribbon protein